MKTSGFEIYGASAGSGKTYILTKEYLKLLLSSDSQLKFRQILAITFTNKAVAEMKNRILENLASFALSNHHNERGLFGDLCKELSLNPVQLQQRSKLVLKRILHNYSFFEISTIDKFNHKIIKTFARDLQLAQNFEVELDTDLLLEQAVGALLERAGSDKELTDVLVAYSLSKIDDNKSWDITYDLMEIGKLLFQENHAPHLEKLRSKSISEFEKIKGSIASYIKEVEDNAVDEAQKALKEILDKGFEHNDFPRQTLPNHFKKIIEKEFSIKVLYSNKLEQNLNENKILKANDKRDASQLSQSILEHYLHIKKMIYRRSYLQNIYTNIVPLTVLNEIAKEVKNIEIEQDIIPISHLNTLLSKEIRNQPVPFIYERLGEKYRHYFIDEFQDTSQMQWQNLVPLIGNALESENEKNERGTLFLVGDVKQAIYRWRGGRAEQFLNLLTLKSNPFVIEPTVRTLDTNWRSYNEIVKFNNGFFTTIAPFLKNTDYQKLFLESGQKTTDISGGYVQLNFIDQSIEDKAEAHCFQVLDILAEVTSKGYSYSDISILVRKNNEGTVLANFLSEKNFPIVSSEALLLKNDTAVVFLISLLKLVENENDNEAIYEVLSFLSPDNGLLHDFIHSHINNLSGLFSETYGIHLNELKNQSTSTILEKAIIKFDLDTSASAHITFLMDEVLDVEKRMGPDVHSFLKYWESKKESLSLTAPEGIDAIKIMTIHKAKGLEFPIVIFPFANMSINGGGLRKKSWVGRTDAEKDLHMEEFLVNRNKDMQYYNELSAAVFNDEAQKTELDALNVLYVALTRAEKALYVVSENPKEASTLESVSSYSDLFQYYLQAQKLEPCSQGKYALGELTENLRTESPASKNRTIPYITRQKKGTPFTISTKSSRLWDEETRTAIETGNLIHYALSLVEVTDDVSGVIKNLKSQGHLNDDNSDEVQKVVNAVVNHPSLKKYYTNIYKVFNEQEILTPEGISFRPDRLVVSNNEVSIIDYKTGKPAPSHQEQILTYAQLLKTMDFVIKDTIIVYIGPEIKPLFL